MQLTSARSDADEASKEKEKAVLQKHQLENQLQSLREEFDMAKRVHEQELRYVFSLEPGKPEIS